MRIGIDARELCGQPTGVGRYLGGLLHEWATTAGSRGHEFILYAPENPAGASSFVTRRIPGPAGTWWEQARLPAAIARDHLDVFFAPGYTAPVFAAGTRRVPHVVTIHDVSFAAHPEWFGLREGLRRRWLAYQAAHQAAAVITVSRFSRQELIEHLSVPEARIHVIPHGLTRPGAAAGAGPPRAAGHEPRLLYVGSIFNRRHVPDLIRAFALVARRRPARLDLVGDNRSHPREDVAAYIARAGVSDRVTWREYVPDAELAELYAGARGFAFLSEYEGFGLTPLEAISAGVPPVLLDTPVARESCGDAALYVAPGDIAGTAAALEAVLFDESVRAALAVRGPQVLSGYSWPRAATQTLTVLESARRGVARQTT